jgi:hypothetical protein
LHTYIPNVTTTKYCLPVYDRSGLDLWSEEHEELGRTSLDKLVCTWKPRVIIPELAVQRTIIHHRFTRRSVVDPVSPCPNMNGGEAAVVNKRFMCFVLLLAGRPTGFALGAHPELQAEKQG